MFHMENVTFDGENERSGRGGVPAIDRAMRLFDAITAGHGAAGVSGLARETGLSKSSVHTLINALLDHRLLDRDGGALVPGGRLISLGEHAMTAQLHATAGAAISRAATSTGETFFFGSVTANRVTILDRATGERALTLSAPVGMSLPVLTGAVGLAYLATLHPEDARDFLHTYPPVPRPGRDPLPPERLVAEAQLAADRGYATERGEYLEGIAAAASAFKAGNRAFVIWAVGIDSTLVGEGLSRLGRAVHGAVRTTAAAAVGASPGRR
jgi:DNA-binding IclR family transcriptional regulator